MAQSIEWFGRRGGGKGGRDREDRRRRRRGRRRRGERKGECSLTGKGGGR